MKPVVLFAQAFCQRNKLFDPEVLSCHASFPKKMLYPIPELASSFPDPNLPARGHTSDVVPTALGK